jgi:hypothetical protein
MLRACSNEAQGHAEAAAGLDMEDLDPSDQAHLFRDQIKQLGFALRSIQHEDNNRRRS